MEYIITNKTLKEVCMSKPELSKSEVFKDINFKELSKNCKNQEDLSSLTKEFMKNMIENILKSELEEYL
jgi:hypothetical protein